MAIKKLFLSNNGHEKKKLKQEVMANEFLMPLV